MSEILAPGGTMGALALQYGPMLLGMLQNQQQQKQAAAQQQQQQQQQGVMSASGQKGLFGQAANALGLAPVGQAVSSAFSDVGNSILDKLR